MQNKKSILKIIIFIVGFIVLFSTITVCVAGSSPTDALIKGMDPGNQSGDPTANSRILTIIAQAFSIIQYIGTGMSLIMVMWLGITYMISSVEEKAEIKKRAVPIVVGSILIVATVNILKLIQSLVTDSLSANP